MPEIRGNIESIRKTVLTGLEALYDDRSGAEEFVPVEIARQMARITGDTGREVSVAIDRRGRVTDISIGDSGTVGLPQVPSARGLCGVRIIHTHPGPDGRPSSVDLAALKKMKLDAMVSFSVENGEAGDVYAAFIDNLAMETQEVICYGPLPQGDKRMHHFFTLIRDIERSADALAAPRETHDHERVILVGVEPAHGRGHDGKSQGDLLLDELEELAETAGVEIAGRILQKKPVHDSATHIGSGKVEELSLLAQSLAADTAIFDDELSGAQIRNLEEVTGLKIIDRTQLILDIFAQRARSREGTLQVELAQLKYRMPRLVGFGGVLSRLGGGIGTRGPGEKKLESDRRHIRRRMNAIERELKEVGKRRDTARQGRVRGGLPTVALAGYTNAGKSTLLNRLCQSDVYVQNQLFATLDPTTRQMQLPKGRPALLTDTVGFIRKLPHDLVEAFRSTLEETIQADILLHVVDVSSPERDTHISVVDALLAELGVEGKPVLLVLNKADKLGEHERPAVPGSHAGVFEISAMTGQGIEALLEAIEDIASQKAEQIELCIPYAQAGAVNTVRENGTVLSEEYLEDGIHMEVLAGPELAGRMKAFRTDLTLQTEEEW